MSYLSYYIENVDNLIVWKGLMGSFFIIFFVLLAIIVLRKRAINKMMSLKTNQNCFADTLFEVSCSLHDGNSIRRKGSTSIYSEKDIDDEFYYINVEVVHGKARMIGESIDLVVRYKCADDLVMKEAVVHNNYIMRDELLDGDQVVRIQLPDISVMEETVIEYSINFDYIDEFEKANNWEYKFSNYFKPLTALSNIL